MRRWSWVAALAAAALVGCTGGGSSSSSPPLTVAVGGCCDDPSCRKNECASGLHCGTAQDPIPVPLCCAVGSRCCRTDSECQPYHPGGACDTTTSACHADCAGDDRRCTAGYHCEGSACARDVTAGACDEPSDCASGNCSTDFDPAATASVCAPAARCANGNQSFDVGTTLCSGAAFFRRCDAPGRWSARVDNPHPTSTICDAGGGADSGVWAAATCTSGLAAVDPGFTSTCASCFPYRGATPGGCPGPGSCTDAPGSCWPGYHCSTHGGNVCATNANGGSCDVDAECTSGRCSAVFQCEPKLANGGSCAKNSDCTSSFCDATVCASLRPDGAVCASASACQHGNCSQDYATATRYCAAADKCHYPTGDVAVGTTFCEGSAPSTFYARTCSSAGTWTDTTNPHVCGFYANGFYIGSCTPGSGPGTGLSLACHECGAYMPNASYSDCLNACSGTNDGACSPGNYCNGSACVTKLADGAPCTRAAMCTSDWCYEGGSGVRCQPRGGMENSPCGRHSDCDEHCCSAGVCNVNGC